MDLERLQQKLLAAARADRPSEEMPYAFAGRVVARLCAGARVPDPLALWSRALWRAAAACVAVTLLFGIWSAFSLNGAGPPPALSAELEATMLASAGELDEFGE